MNYCLDCHVPLKTAFALRCRSCHAKFNWSRPEFQQLRLLDLSKATKVNIGSHHSGETKLKMSESAKKSGTGLWNKGKHLSLETRQKLSQSIRRALLGVDRSGIRNANYKTGGTLVQHYCPKCQEPIGIPSKQCRRCAHSRPIHSEEFKLRLSHDRRGRKSPRFGKPMRPTWGSYNGIMMRSSWERKYAENLDRQSTAWEYESKTFDLGDTTYTPDFFLPTTNEFIEIKGFDTTVFIEKLQLFRVMYPTVKLSVLYEDDLRLLQII